MERLAHGSITKMLIVSGWLQVHADQREEYLIAANEASRLARAAPGCWEFVQAADPLVPGRIVILERWESESDLVSFRNSGSEDEEPLVLPDVLDATVKRYVISEVGPA